MTIYSSASNQPLNTTSTPLFNNVTNALTIITTSGGTTTLTSSSTNGQLFTGTSTQTVVLPLVSTLNLGEGYRIINRSTGAVTVQSSGGNIVQVMDQNTTLLVICISQSGTTETSWQAFYNPTTPFDFPLAPDLGGTGIANDSSSTQTINGAYPLTLNLTNDTDVTLPVDGTLTNQKQVQRSAFNYGIDTGVANDYIVDLDPAIKALTDGLMLAFTPLNSNDSNNVQLSVNGNTSLILSINGQPPAINDLINNNIAYLIYSASFNAWTLLNAQVSNVTAYTLQSGAYWSGTDGGSANAYVVTLDQGTGVDLFFARGGSQVYFVPDNTNTGPSTLIVNNWAVPIDIIMMDGSDLPAGALLIGKEAWVVYGVNSKGTLGWILMNPQGGTSRSGGLIYVSVSGTSETASAGTAYILNNAAATTVTLPASSDSTIGDTIKIKGRSSAAFIVQANTSQVITEGSNSSTSGGTATSAAGTDSIQLVYVALNEWSIDWTLSAGFVLA